MIIWPAICYYRPDSYRDCVTHCNVRSGIERCDIVIARSLKNHSVM